MKPTHNGVVSHLDPWVDWKELDLAQGPSDLRATEQGSPVNGDLSDHDFACGRWRPAKEVLAASEVSTISLLLLHENALSHFHLVSLPFCLPHSDRYFNKCLSDTVKLKVEQKLEQMGKAQGVWLHTAHVLCMDAILSVGLEMGSHNPDCWPHVFRCMMVFPTPDGTDPALDSLGW